MTENPLRSLMEDKELIEAYNAYTAAAREFIELITLVVVAAAKAIGEITPQIEAIYKAIPNTCEAILKQCPNKRVIHLAKHAKKARVRKKNIKRIIKHITTAQSGPR